MEMMLSRSYCSKEEFVKDYKESCVENSKAKEFYLLVLIELAKAIPRDDIESFKKLSSLLDYTRDLESVATLRDFYDDTDNPIRSTNLVILASKHNGIKILQYLLDSDSELLKNVSVGIGKDSISPNDEDDVHHNAFYYAIRSENIQLLDTLVTCKYFNNYFAVHSEELEEILSRTYEELKLKNVTLSDEMQFTVEHKLIDHRFFSAEQNPSPTTKDLTKIKERIKLLLHSISLLKEIYFKTRKVDAMFLYVVKFISRNIHILKGQLKSTYDKIPWEEMEFCLVVFISSHSNIKKLNLFYRAILNKEKVLNYLENFAENITRANLSIDNFHCLPRGRTREEIVKNIIAAYPQFKELYTDYHQIRDIYSLNKIYDYINLAVSVNPQEDQGQFVIIRVLQVMGEHLKNTLESPKLSHTTSELLILSLSPSAKKYIIELRDAISHAESLAKIMEIEEKEKFNVTFFINIQNDVRKVGDVITDIFYKNRIKIIRMLLKKVVESKTSDEMKEVLEELGAVDWHSTDSDNLERLEHEKLGELIEELSDNIVDKTNYESELFKKINRIINSAEKQSENVWYDYITGFLTLKAFKHKLNHNDCSDEYLLKETKRETNKVLNNITEKIKRQRFDKIGRLAHEIFQSVKSRIQNDQLFEELIRKIFFFVTYELGEIKSIEELREKLPTLKQKKTKLISEDQSNNHLELKLSKLKIILIQNSLNEFMSDKVLQTVVKMLVLDIMVILGRRDSNYLQNNILFMDDITPLLHGKCLRNYLAHDNALVDVLLSDPLIAVISNAIKLTKENIIEGKKKIGKLVSDDPAKLRKKFDEDLDIIANQERMFVALEEGDLRELKDCLKKGADIKARSTINSWTTLHFAAKGHSLEVVRFIVDQNLSIDVKDNNGETPLHIAAAYGRQDIVNFFLKETNVCVDVVNNEGETPLHVAAQNGHKVIVEDLLRNKANIFTRDRNNLSPLYYAIRYNHIDVVKILLRKDLKLDIHETMDGLTALQLAAFFGHLKLVHLLLESGANIKATTDKNEEPLHLATLNGHLEVVNALVLQGADVNARTIDGWMPLHFAVYNDNVKLVSALITNGAYVNIATTTPLHIAAQFGHLKVVTVLLQHGANIHAQDGNNSTPLHYAAKYGHKEVLKFLIQCGAQINPTNKINNPTPLHEAVVNGHRDVAHVLIGKNADVNTKFKKGYTAMHAAADNGNTEILDLLIKNKAEVNVRCRKSQTPLHFAIKEGHKTAVELLIKSKADVNEGYNDGSTPLHVAVLHGHKEIVNLLIENNAKVDLEDIANSSITQPLHVAARAGHKEIVEILIANGANVNDKNYIQTPLYCAIINNHKKIVEVLIEKGANINVEDFQTWSLPFFAGCTDIVKTLLKNTAYVNYKDSNYLTPLHMAAIGGHTKIVKALITNGADVNALSINEETPLLCAAQEGFEVVVEILIASGAEVNLRNKQGCTSLHRAAVGGHSKVVNILLNNKAEVDIKDIRNQSPLLLAVAGGHLQVVKLLLKYMKGNINAEEEQGNTLLHIASQGTNFELVRYLVDEGSDINAKTSFGLKAIHVAAGKGFMEAVKFFLSMWLSVNELGTHNQTLLHGAAMEGRLEMVKYLIDQRADINAKDTINGFSPMHFAAVGGHKDVIEVLINNGAIYNAFDRFHRKPIELAKNKDVIKLLDSTDKLFKAVEINSLLEVQNCITAGALVNAKNAEDVRPLYHATCNGYDDVVKVLLQNKANPNVVDNKGFTSLHYAAEFSHLQVVKALLSHYAVYNAVSDDGRTPLDFAVDKSIISLFKAINDSFKSIEIDNCQVISDLNEIRDIDTIKAIMCARNRENESLVVAAMNSNFSKVEELINIGQRDVSAQVKKAIELLELDHYQEALCLFEDAFNKRKDILGLDNPGTLDIQKFIADILHKTGNCQEALKTFEEILQKQKEMLGFDSEGTLQTRSSIANVLNSQGKFEEALNIYQIVYQKQKQLLGPTNVDTLSTQANMALVLNFQGKHEEALRIFRSVKENTKPEDYRSTLSVQSNIAQILKELGNNEEALSIYENIFKEMKVVLGINHSSTLTTLHNIGEILFKQKKYNESLAVFKDVLSRQEKILKPNHPNILMTQFHIGNVFFAQRKYINALKAYREVFDQMKAVLESDHPAVLDILTKIEAINIMWKLEGNNPSTILQYLRKSINFAASKGDVRTIQSLLEDGADPNDKDQDGRTPLHYAISNGHINVVNILLNHGADLPEVTKKGNTPLHIATYKGYSEIVEILLRHVNQNPDEFNCFINAKTTASGSTSLHAAARNGFMDIAMSLLKRGAIYDIKNNKGKTPLDLCKDPNISDMFKSVENLFQDAKNGNVEIIKKLKRLKPDEFVAAKNARNNQNYTLLEVLITNKYQNIARDLSEMLDEKVKVNILKF